MEKVEEAADAQISNGGPDGTASLVEVERADRVEQKERVPALERNATVLFNIAWTESESGKQTVTFERQASRTDHPVTLSWSGLHVVAPGAGPTLVQRLKGNLNGKPDKLILNDGNRSLSRLFRPFKARWFDCVGCSKWSSTTGTTHCHYWCKVS